MSFEPLSFETIKDDERSVLNSDAQLDILTLFQTAINSSSYPNIDEKAKRFVTDLVAFAPEGKSGLDADAIASATWKVLINTASCIPCWHYGQDVLVKIVSFLSAASDTWKDYHGFGIAVRENWNRSPLFQLGDDDEGEFTLDEWLNLNSFVARLGKEFISFGLWEMRNGLEGLKGDEKPAPEAVVNTRNFVATEWIIQGGRGLLRESMLSALSHEQVAVAHGVAVLCFQVPGDSILSDGAFGSADWGGSRKAAIESIQKPIDEAVELMTALEAEAANSWYVN